MPAYTHEEMLADANKSAAFWKAETLRATALLREVRTSVKRQVQVA